MKIVDVNKMIDMMVHIAADLFWRWEEEKTPEKAKGLEEFLDELSKKFNDED